MIGGIAAIVTVGAVTTAILLFAAPRPGGAGRTEAVAASPSATHPVVPTPTATAVIVPSAPPVQLSVPAIGIDAVVSLYTTDEAAQGVDGATGKPCLADGIIRCIDPQSLTQVAWQQSGVGSVAFGAEPGTQSTGTVYLYGHASSSAQAVFNNIGALQPGDEANVTTAKGVLRYQVQRTIDALKSQFPTSPEAIDQVPGRLLLISCDHSPHAKMVNGGYSVDNLVVVLQLEAN